MPLDWKAISRAPRAIVDARLSPRTGHLIQPAGAPDIGAVTYSDPSDRDRRNLIVDSQQSVANHLEAVLFDDPFAGVLAAELDGMPFVRVNDAENELLTTSLQEAHRLNSPYFLEAKIEGNGRTGEEWLQAEVGAIERPIDRKKLTDFLFANDPNSLLHGLWLSSTLGGRFKLQRALAGIIEAYDVEAVPIGGTKVDRVNPGTDKKSSKTSKEGYGNVPHHALRYTAKEIHALFNLDLVQIRSYQLDDDGAQFLILLALWKIRRFLETHLRLRTDCDLQCDSITVTSPENFELPSLEDLTEELRGAIERLVASGQFHRGMTLIYDSSQPTQKKKAK